MTETAVPQVVVLDIRTRKVWDGEIAPPLKPEPEPLEYYGPWLPNPDKMALQLLQQVTDRVLAGELRDIAIIGINVRGYPFAAMSVGAEFNPATHGARLAGAEVLKEILMDQLADSARPHDEEYDDEDFDEDEYDDEDPAS